MWSKYVSAREIVDNIKRAKLKGRMYSTEFPFDDCWTVRVRYSPYNRNQLNGLDVTLTMKYKRGDIAIVSLWLVVNDQFWDSIYRSGDKLSSIDSVTVIPFVTKADCCDTRIDGFKLPKLLEQRVNNIYREYLKMEYLTPVINKPKHSVRG